MSCSKNKAVKYLIDKQLIKPNMELYGSLPTKRLSDTIDRLTSLAKKTYGVDMGDLFSLKFRDVSRGDYLVLGSSAIVTKVKVEPNDPAFDAIDRSKAQEEIAIQRRKEEDYYKKLGQVKVEYDNIQEEGNFVVTEEGDIQVPSSLPKINIRC